MKRFLIHYVIIVTTLITLIACFFPQQEFDLGYNILWIHPFVFLFIYMTIYIPLINMEHYKITSYSFVFLAWLRCVMIPLGSVLTGVYNGVSYIYVSEDSVKLAILLVAFELIITSVFLYFMIKIEIGKKEKLGVQYKQDNLVLAGNKYIYALFILFAMGLYFLEGKDLNLIQFFIITVDAGVRQGDLDSTKLVLIRQIFTTAFTFFFVWCTSYCKERYDATRKSKYVNFAIIAGIFNIGIIVGERRTTQLYTSLVVIFILTQAFGNDRRKIKYTISTTAIIIILFMSIYKHFAAFIYGSYYDALSSADINLEWLTKTLQSYFFGTQNVATAIELNNYIDLDITNMIYDFGRSIFGLNFLLKGRMAMTSEIFNTFIYGKATATGHVISGVGYGYLYLGALLSPIIVCLNVFISIKLEKWFNKTNSYEMKYIVGYMLVRFSTNIFVNTPPLISLATNMLFTAGLVYFVARIFNSSMKLSMGTHY